MISDTKVSKITQKPLFYKAFTVWELAQAGSTPVIPTKNQPKMRFFAPLSADFMLIIGFYPPLRQIRLTAETRLVP